MDIKDLTIEEKIGQMLMMGINIPEAIEKLELLITKYKIGGILLYRKNYKDYNELIDLINRIKEINSVNKVPIFIAIDQEGGRVNRMPKDFKNLPSAHSLAEFSENNDSNLVREAGKITGEMLNKIGINMDFAPVLDIKRFNDNHAIGDRAYSSDTSKVYKYGIDFMKELTKKKVISVVKHFPGHGATSKDSHFRLPKIKENMSKLEKEDMIPFEKAIQEGADALLVSHLKIKGATQKMPASMSRRFITKYIRKKYRFRGLIITDDMKMKGISMRYGKNKPIEKAFFAGNDIILIKCGNDEKTIDKIIDEVKKSPLKQARVNRAVKRILKTKEKYDVNNNKISIDTKFVQTINEKIENIRMQIQN